MELVGELLLELAEVLLHQLQRAATYCAHKSQKLWWNATQARPFKGMEEWQGRVLAADELKGSLRVALRPSA